ncbi:conserved Plasmodium protein, unknown function [Plasmodium ovale wallikeri]|uniref:Uncharacterized protein n=2 Tax=Plasmodium ovale TaxID=36330 RepID=A0A1A8YMY0_PLAOA|nr:conserved Plasmodium protein, unknown function [Plasmodium ovale wallikeri]SBT33223.1 conserved Plasmodium protein, unknown function [Plasmodium ovale wallikeri]SBT76044.1 conserved Plasmodium protein, unknown function [Plasmodium ovale]
MDELPQNLMEKSRELGEIFFKSTKNDMASVKYLNECRNGECSEFYGTFNLVYSNLISTDANWVLFKEHLLFLSFSYMSKLLEIHYNGYTTEDKIQIRNSFVNILFSLPLHFDHVLENNVLHLKEKSVDMLKRKFRDTFLSQPNVYIANFMNSLDNYCVRFYTSASRNKISQILCILCMRNEYTYFRYVLNFILFFMTLFLKKKLALSYWEGVDSNVVNSIGSMCVGEEEGYFDCTLHISVNFLREIFYMISNETSSNVVNRQQLSFIRTILINDVNELFSFFYFSFYYCFSLGKRKEFEILLECLKELSFFFPAHFFFSDSNNSPVKFLLNTLLIRFTRSKHGEAMVNDYSAICNGSGEKDEFEKFYIKYMEESGSVGQSIQTFLKEMYVEETLLIIFLNIIEYITRINNKTFFQLNEDNFMKFLNNYFGINLNYYDVYNYTIQNIYLQMILNLSGIPISNYLNKKENKKNCFHIYIVNIFKNIHHPNGKILTKILTICKNIFENNRDIIYIKNKEKENKIYCQKYNIYRIDKVSLLNENNEKMYNENYFVITCNDLRKLFILLYVRFMKIPIYKDANSQNKKLMITFTQNCVNEYDNTWFEAYYEHILEYIDGDNLPSVLRRSVNCIDVSGNRQGDGKSEERQQICSLLRVLISLNHDVYHIMLDVFFNFFQFYENVNISNLCNEVMNVKDYFVYNLLRAYYQLLTFFVNTLKECKSVITDGDAEVNGGVIAYQLLAEQGDADHSRRDDYVQNKLNLKKTLLRSIDNATEEEEKEGGKIGETLTKITQKEITSSSIDALKKKKERIDLELHIIKCAEKYEGSPYYEINPHCINGLLSCYKTILQRDFTEMVKLSPTLHLFEVKRLQFLSENTYVLNYNKEYAFFILENLLKKIVQNEEETMFEFKKNYLSIFTSIVNNLQNYLTKDILLNLLKTLLQYKKGTNYFKCNKEFSIFLLTLVSILPSEDLNENVPYIKMIIEDSYEYMENFRKNITSMESLYKVIYEAENRIENVYTLLEVYKIVQNYFTAFSLHKNGFYLRRNVGKDDIVHIMERNTRLVNENEFLRITMHLFSTSMLIFPIFNSMVRSNVPFESFPMLCSEVSYFHLNAQGREIANSYVTGGKTASRGTRTSTGDDGCGKKFIPTIRMFHESLCGVVKKFVSEGFLFLHNEAVLIFNDVLSVGLQYSPFYLFNQNVLSIYISLSEKIKYLIGNKIMNALIIRLYVEIFAVFLERKVQYFKLVQDHIKCVNMELSKETNVKEEDYEMYCDMLYKSKNYIFNYLKICKNLFILPHECKSNHDSQVFYCCLYNEDNKTLLNSLLLTFEYLLNSHDCSVTKRCLSFLQDMSDSIVVLTFHSTHLFTILQIAKVALRSFLLYNPPVLTLQQSGKNISDVGGMCTGGMQSNAMVVDCSEERMNVYVGEMNLFMKNDPQEMGSFLNVFTSAFVKISKNYFLLHKNILNISESTPFNELLTMESVKHFLLLFENMDSSFATDFHVILQDLLKQGPCDHLKNFLIQHRLRETRK